MSDAELLAHIRASLGEWCLGDIKRAASEAVELPRLAFVGLAAWVDTLAILYTGKRKSGYGAWLPFIRDSGFFPVEMRTDREVQRLYDGLRNALLHEYGTRGVALTHGAANASGHWRMLEGDVRLLHLESLVRTFEEGFKAFLAALERDVTLRERVLPEAQGLLGPVQVPPENLNASVSQSATITLGHVRGAIAASATGPLDPRGGATR